MLRPIAATLLATALSAAGSGIAWAAESITIDFVRHGEAGDNLVINNDWPGPGLTADGWQQAHDVIGDLHGIDGVFSSTMTRAIQTATPLAGALGITGFPELAGLNEIDAGIFAGLPVNVGGLPVGAVAYALAPAAWTLGLYFVPQPGSVTDVNGMAFQDRYSDAVQTIYDTSITNGDGDVAVFSHEASIAMWTLMNVRNPDFPLMLQLALTNGELLPYAGVVEVTGNPTDGWTLVSWDGQAVPADPGLPTELFVDFRDLITTPQLAAWHVWEALAAGDPTAVAAALQAAISDVGTATAQFPFAVGSELVDAVGDIAAGDLAGLFPAVAELAGLLLG